MLNGSPGTVFLGILPATLRIHGLPELKGPFQRSYLTPPPHCRGEKTEVQRVKVQSRAHTRVSKDSDMEQNSRLGSLAPNSFFPPPFRIWLPLPNLCPPVQNSPMWP